MADAFRPAARQDSNDLQLSKPDGVCSSDICQAPLLEAQFLTWPGPSSLPAGGRSLVWVKLAHEQPLPASALVSMKQAIHNPAGIRTPGILYRPMRSHGQVVSSSSQGELLQQIVRTLGQGALEGLYSNHTAALCASVGYFWKMLGDLARPSCWSVEVREPEALQMNSSVRMKLPGIRADTPIAVNSDGVKPT
ncbi:hypothetical protein WJX74_008305 [Apatococcus lobatus]|uniref:Uncharacterized protein n=1 Tax=Apatococcus lobatus TaxID=904363 RepID=A0AAW1RY71_9CHLO